MKGKPQSCLEIEVDLVAAATGDAEPGAVHRVERHIDFCAPCRGEFQRYREIDGVVGALRRGPAAAESVARAREGLESRLADLRSRLVSYRIFPSPLGHILIARSEHGVSLVEYLGARTDLAASRLSRATGVEPQEDGADIEALFRELLEDLRGDRTRLEWALDLRLARSDFHRAVLQATAAVPYGAVTSYAGIAAEIGKPAATRAVAQALRWNPLPIVVPCHRIIGTSGALTGYSGNKIGLKRELLAVEGIRAVGAPRDSHVLRQALYHYERNEQHEYCLPTCGDIARRPIGRVTLMASRDLAESLGLVPCTSCRPDLHPLAV
jgi:methylated-DNA-[protein]-cysteine S-methyltransferase